MRVVKTQRSQENVRSYKLKLYGNNIKTDTARYTYMRYNQYMNMFLGRIFFGEKNISTLGTDDIASRACHKAFLKIKTLYRAQKKTGIKINVPYATREGCYALLEKSKSSNFDYWLVIANMWISRKPIRLPAKSHRALNKALRNGWRLSEQCEFKMFNGKPYAMVFVKKEIPKEIIPKKIIGCDVGITHSVMTSEGYKGHGLSRIIRIQKRRQVERQRQGHKVSRPKSVIKQILDREATKIIRRSVNLGAGIAVESPNRIGALCRGNLHGWASSYFANRLGILGKENGVKIMEINPYQTSVTCSKCGVVDKRSRMGRIFKCIACNYTAHADYNAAINIASHGGASLKSDGKKSGSHGVKGG